ncbi:MAG: zinc dependent phospholipase C family protein [Methanobacteriaceae archaeon]|nr:zinc dependent phospholipase C family protein [Methanobacteriaceae archaeon]
MKKRTHLNIARLSIANKAPSYKDINSKFIYKWLFCLGTILPDLSVMQFVHPHYYIKSADYIFSKLIKIKEKPYNGIVDALVLGKIVHYLSDYCCYVHHNGCIGNISKHALYESKLNEYVLENYQDLCKNVSKNYSENEDSVDIIVQIKNKLTDYSNTTPSFDADILTSIEISSIVFYGILQTHGVPYKVNIDDLNSYGIGQTANN